MLNIGQIVYDFNNKRTIIFGGVEILQNQKTGKCASTIKFFNENGDIEDYDKVPFEYSNFPKQGPDDKVPLGSLILKVKLLGFYFGVLKDNLGEKSEAARQKLVKEVIREAEELNLIKPTQKEK